VTAEEAMERISTLLDDYYKNGLRDLQLIARVSQVVGEYEGSK
jgi:hypothetical protein